MHVDDVIFTASVSMNRMAKMPPTEVWLWLALGVTEAQLTEALWVLSVPGDKRIEYPAKDRVALGADWRPRCERPG
jgi:hypothetical protein